MSFSLSPGPIHEPMAGRSLSADECLSQSWTRRVLLKTKGMKRGDRVVIAHGNNINFFLDLLAIWACGGTVIPLDSQLTAFELHNLLAAAKPRFLVHDGELLPKFRTVLNQEPVTLVNTSAGHIDADGPGISERNELIAKVNAARGEALILFTSGSTGRPKGVAHTHGSLRAKWQALKVELNLRTFERTLCVLPTHFGHGLICNALFPWLQHQELFVLPAFSPQVVLSLGRVLTDHGITFLSSVPAIWQLALKTPRPKNIELMQVFCGSAPLSTSLWEQIKTWCGGATVRNLYGITETGSWIAASPAGGPATDGMVGTPLGASIKITEGGSPEHSPSRGKTLAKDMVGYVWIKTPALMQGYLDRPDLTAQAVSEGWFSAGDIGLIDADGRLVLKGRERDEINRGGMKVYPTDVEAVAASFPLVCDTCCFACADPHYGQSVGIALVMDDDAPSTLKALHAWISERLASHKVPTSWYSLDEIPKTSRGKVNRSELALHCAGRTPVDMKLILETAS